MADEILNPYAEQRKLLNPYEGRDFKQEEVDEYKAKGGGFTSSVKRGLLRANQTFNAAGAGLGDAVMGAMPESIRQSDIGQWLQGQADEDKQDVIRDTRTLQGIPNHPTTVNMTNRANQEDTFLGGLSVIADEFIKSPDKAGWFVDTMAEQIPVIATMAIGTKGAGNLLGTATKASTAATFGIGAGVGSMGTTFGSNVAEAMGEDVSKFDEAMSYAFTRSLAQGIVDGTVGAFVPFKIGGLHKINVPTQALLQAVGGAGGEAAGAAAVGQEVKTGDLLMEGLLELLSAPADVVMARMESLNPKVEEEKPWFKAKKPAVDPAQNQTAQTAQQTQTAQQAQTTATAGLTGANKFNDPTTITGTAANKPQKTAEDFKDRQAPEVASLIFHRKLHDKQEDGEKQYGAAIARIQAVADTAASSGRTDVKDEALKVIKWLDDEKKNLPFYAPEEKGILKAESSLLAKLKAPGKSAPAASPDVAPTKPTVGATAVAEEQPAETDDEEEEDVDQWANSVLGEGEPTAPAEPKRDIGWKDIEADKKQEAEPAKNPRGDIAFVDMTPTEQPKQAAEQTPVTPAEAQPAPEQPASVPAGRKPMTMEDAAAIEAAGNRKPLPPGIYKDPVTGVVVELNDKGMVSASGPASSSLGKTSKGTEPEAQPAPKNEFAPLFDDQGSRRFPNSPDVKKFKEENNINGDGIREIYKAVAEGRTITLDEARTLGEKSAAERKASFEKSQTPEARQESDRKELEKETAKQAERDAAVAKVGKIEPGIYEDVGTGLEFNVFPSGLILTGSKEDVRPYGTIEQGKADDGGVAFATWVSNGIVAPKKSAAQPDSEIGKSAKSNAETTPVTGVTPEAAPQPITRSKEVSDLYESLASRAEAAGAPTLAKDIRKGLNTFGDTDEQARSRAETFEAIVKNKEARNKNGQAALKQPATQEPAEKPAENKAVAERLEAIAKNKEAINKKRIESGHRINTPEDKARADRLQMILDDMTDRVPKDDIASIVVNDRDEAPITSAKMHLRSVIEALRQESTPVSVVAMLETAADRLFAKRRPQSDAVSEIAEELKAADEQAAKAREAAAILAKLKENSPGKPLSKIEISMDFTDEKGEHSTIKGNAEKLLSLMDKRIDTYKRLWECVTK